MAMLTARAKNLIVDKINMAFASIGKDMPKSKALKNNEQQAWEYFVSSHLYKLAGGRREEAKAQAVAAHVIPDTDDPANQRDGGTLETVFVGDIVSVTLAVSKPRVTYDIERLKTYLLNNKVDPKVVHGAMEHASKTAKAGHQFTAALITGEPKASD